MAGQMHLKSLLRQTEQLPLAVFGLLVKEQFDCAIAARRMCGLRLDRIIVATVEHTD